VATPSGVSQRRKVDDPDVSSSAFSGVLENTDPRDEKYKGMEINSKVMPIIRKQKMK